MIDPEKFLLNERDGSRIPIKPWIPPKVPVANLQDFTISASSVSESLPAPIQFAITRQGIKGDLLRADSYREGYFAASWLSKVSLKDFLIFSERYFRESIKGEASGCLSILTSRGESDQFDFNGAITIEELKEGGIFLGDHINKLGLLRIDTVAGDVIFEPEERKAGIIADLIAGQEEARIGAVARFVTRTQVLLSEEVVAKTIALLPYRKLGELSTIKA